MHLDLPNNRIKSLAELASLEEAYFVVPGNHWGQSLEPMKFTGNVTVLKWPTTCIGQSQDVGISGDAYRVGPPFDERRPAYSFLLDERGLLLGIKVSEFNLVKHGRKKYGPAAAFRTQKDADLWGVTVSLALDHVGHKADPIFDFDFSPDKKFHITLYDNILAILTA